MGDVSDVSSVTYVPAEETTNIERESQAQEETEETSEQQSQNIIQKENVEDTGGTVGKNVDLEA